MSDFNFKIHTIKGELSALDFNKAVSGVVSTLNQFDAGISMKSRGILNWFVTDLRSNGSFSINFTSHLKPIQAKYRVPDNITNRVTDQFLTGFDEIETKCETPPYLSEAGLERVGEFASLLERGDVSKFSFETKSRKVEVTEQTSKNVRSLLPANRKAFGSIEGRLEGINVHKNFKGLLYHAITNKVVTCIFDESQLEDLKKALSKRVIVTGDLLKNIKGDTIRIINPNLEIVEGTKRFSLPSLGTLKPDLSKAPSFANARTTAEYVRRMRGD